MSPRARPASFIDSIDLCFQFVCHTNWPRTLQGASRQQKLQKNCAGGKMADPNGAEAGVKFLAENKGKPGVITLPSGLRCTRALLDAPRGVS
jgi:FKBP-type peptidyl-prolyl cis-trans isomerase